MKKGYSIVVTATDSGHSKYFFLPRKWVKPILVAVLILVIAIVIAFLNYSRVYYQALQSVMIRRRNAEIEREFAKLKEIERNLDIAEMNNRKLRIMLGIEKSPPSVEPSIDEISSDYSEKINMMARKEKNIPSLLPTRGELSREFGPTHQGIDIAAPRFSPIVAAASGVVRETGWDSIYGNYIIIDHDVNYSTFYGHLHSTSVKTNDKIASGELIGTVGSTGKSTSPHLHYEVRFQNKPVEPLSYLPFAKL